MLALILLGVLTQLLGIGLWAGWTGGWRPLHIAFGFALVFGLWSFAWMGAKAGVERYRVWFAVFWGFWVIALGFFQGELFTGERHRSVRMAHLVVGFAAMIQIAKLSAGIRAASLAKAAAAAGPT